MKKLKFLSAAMAAVVLATSIALPASASAATPAPVKTAPISDSSLTANEFNVVAEPFSYGVDVTKLIVNVGTAIGPHDVNSDCFSVQAKAYTVDTHKQVWPDLDSPDDFYNKTAVDADNPNGDRYVTDTFVCDKDGNKVTSGKSNYVMVCLTHGYKQVSDTDYKPLNGCQAAFYESNFAPLDLKYTLTQKKAIAGITGTLTFTQNKVVDPATDCWDQGSATNAKGDQTINYSAYAPVKDGQKHPLLVWLHGMGEGGPYAGVNIIGNRVTAFSSAEGQKALNNAYVLAPQCPQFWPLNDTGFSFTARSKYVDLVQQIIDNYIKDHSDIDTSRIYMGGLSMGGYMAWQMLLNKPSMYAGAVIASAAYAPIDDDYQKVKDIPTWLVYCDTDTTCVPSLFSAATIKKFESLGATKLHYSEYGQVVADGIRYPGHCAWNYVYDNSATDDTGKTNLHVLNWLGSQAKGSITLDTRSYTMAPKNTYDVGVKLANIGDKTVKVYSSNNGAAKVTKLTNGNYRITGVAVGTSYITFEVHDKSGSLLTHASIKVTVANGAKQHGDATKATSAF